MDRLSGHEALSRITQGSGETKRRIYGYDTHSGMMQIRNKTKAEREPQPYTIYKMPFYRFSSFCLPLSVLFGIHTCILRRISSILPSFRIRDAKKLKFPFTFSCHGSDPLRLRNPFRAPCACLSYLTRGTW